MADLANESRNLERLQSFIEDMNSTNSTLEKAEKLQKYVEDDYIKNALLYTYDPYRKYNVTPANLEKNSEMLSGTVPGGLFEMLDDLHSRKYTGHAAIGYVNSFVKEHGQYKKSIVLVLDRNLKIRMDVSEINKVFGDFIPTFDVALAKAFERAMALADKKGKKKVDFEKDVWFGSRKLDGCRCLCVIDEDGGVSFRSREGHEFFTLSVLAEEVRRWGLKSVVFDGEICLMRPDGSEDFQGVMKQIRKKDHTIKNPKYNLFDQLTLEEFRAKKGKVKLSERYENLKKTLVGIEAVRANPVYVSVLSQERIQSIEHLDKLSELASKNGWEGLIIRRDVPYEGKRSSDMLKVKEMQDAEYVVTGVENCEITTTFYRDKNTGEEVEFDDGAWRQVCNGAPVDDDAVQSYSDTRVMVSKLVIVHKGNPVGVGSGLSMRQRREWYVDPSRVIGKTVTIQYFQETEVDGRLSLRFPVLKWKYDGKRDV